MSTMLEAAKTALPALTPDEIAKLDDALKSFVLNKTKAGAISLEGFVAMDVHSSHSNG